MGDVDNEDAGSDFGDDLQYDFVAHNLDSGQRNDPIKFNEGDSLPLHQQVK